MGKNVDMPGEGMHPDAKASMERDPQEHMRGVIEGLVLQGDSRDFFGHGDSYN